MKPLELLHTDGSAEIEVCSSDCESIHAYVLHYSKSFNINTELIAVYDQDFSNCDSILLVELLYTQINIIFRKQRPCLQIGNVATYKVA